MANKHDQARELAEEGLDAILDGDRGTGEKMIEKAKSLDPKAAAEAGEEAQAEGENAKRYLRKTEREASHGKQAGSSSSDGEERRSSSGGKASADR